jgi:predicted transcriptional regulator
MLPSYRRKKSASLLGVTQVYISYMEGGKKRPGKTMKKLLVALNVNGREVETATVLIRC